jgi:putative transposase
MLGEQRLWPSAAIASLAETLAFIDSADAGSVRGSVWAGAKESFMPTTTAKTHQDVVDRASEERSEPVGRAQRSSPVQRRAPLRQELVDRALDESSLRRAIGELSGAEQIPDEVIDGLLAGARTEEEIAGPGGLLAQLTKRLIERALEVELTEHLGYEPHAEPPGGTGNTRNGATSKTLATEHGQVEIKAPRDRDSSFAPKIVRKRQRRFVGFDDKILALYSRGLSTRDIEAHLQEIYGVKVGRELISKVTDAVMDDVREWAKRPLEDVYPVVFLDALVLKIREGGSVQRKACYLALGVTVSGEREVLGMWFQDTEGAKFWMQVLSDLKQRGVQDILICCVDGLKGFPEAIEAIFPQTTVQTCVVHLIRHSLKYVPRREREQVARDLKPIYSAIDADQAQEALERFDDKWGQRFPVITKAWLDAWEHVIPFLAFPAEVRRVIYTTNAIEALNRQLRKAIKTKGHFPSEDAARKLIYLALTNATPQWTRCRNWTIALLAFKIHFGDRLPDITE